MSKIIVFMLHVTSFLPLWLSVLFIDFLSIFTNAENLYTEWISIISIIVVNILAYIVIGVWMKTEGRQASDEVKLCAVKEEKKISAEFILAYILPLMAFDFTRWDSAIIFLFFFLCLGYISTKHNSVSINLGLELAKYSLYECEVQSTEYGDDPLSMLLLSRHGLIDERNRIVEIKSINNEIGLYIRNIM